MTDTNPQTYRNPGFLQDDRGKSSTMRLMSFVALIAAIAFGLVTILHPAAREGVNGLYITMSFLLAAFAPKALQKFAETKPQNQGKPN